MNSNCTAEPFHRSDTSTEIYDSNKNTNWNTQLGTFSGLHPLDDSLLECITPPLSQLSTQGNDHHHCATIKGSSSHQNEEIILKTTHSLQVCHLNEDLNVIQSNENSVQGSVRRKTIQKDGRRPAVSSWQRYWLQIWSNTLIYFSPKGFKGGERSDFKREPSKVCLLEGWSVRRCAVDDNGKQKHVFELWNDEIATVYRFRTDSAEAAEVWVKVISKNMKNSNNLQRLPKISSHNINLMSFE